MAHSRIFIAAFIGLLLFSPIAQGAGGGCTTTDCHPGTPAIVPPQLPMMQLIRQTGQRHGDPQGCVICHGGNPNARKKKAAHRGVPPSLGRGMGPKAFYPNPGDLSVADNTCGVCHIGYGARLRTSLMQTQVGMVQGNFTAWGLTALPGLDGPMGTADFRDEDGAEPVGGTPDYSARMAAMKKEFPRQYPGAIQAIPRPDPAAVEARPELAGALYQRRECQRCHINGPGLEQAGDFRGRGCAACHVEYDNATGRPRAHAIQGNGKTGGIPRATCGACHNRGKYTAQSFGGSLGLVHPGPPGTDGQPASPVHGRYPLALPGDVHHQPGENNAPGLLCQDCHTSIDVHGDGNLQTTTLAVVEIECSDCHGTPAAFPWELPLGVGDEYGMALAVGPRGTAGMKTPDQQRFGEGIPVKDGFLISTRGNPLGNVVREGEGAILFSATGRRLTVPLLKQRRNAWTEKDIQAQTAMVTVAAHVKQLECYACHSPWAPQIYGDHVRLDFSDAQARGRDWVDGGELPGTLTVSHEYQRWESPLLGVNGEGRVSPLMPSGQIVYSVVDRQGQSLALGKIAVNAREGQALGLASAPAALTTAPVQPHTTGKARSCESCHARPESLGLGGLKAGSRDWTRLVDASGNQRVTVGSHWPGSRAFTAREVGKILRTGVCLGCHQTMDRPEIWKGVSSEQIPDTEAHRALMGKLLKDAAGPVEE